MLKVAVPEILPTSPLSLWCPYCGAKPGKDCSTRKGGLAVLHTLRVIAASLVDTKGREVRIRARRTAWTAHGAKKRARKKSA